MADLSTSTTKERSYWDRLNNAWQESRLVKQSRQIANALSDRFDKYQDEKNAQSMVKLGVSGLPFSNPPAKAPALNWAPGIPGNSRQGYTVPDPSLDQYMNFWKMGQSPDILERRALYDEYDKICSTSVIIADAMDDLINGACRQGGRIKIVPVEPLIDDPRIQDQAASFDEQWQRTMALATVEWECLVAKSFLRYGNAPIEIVANDLGVIEELDHRAPYRMQINSDVHLKFSKGQRDAYVQFDDASQHWIARYPEALVVWLMTKDLGWHRYGMSRLFAALAAARALIRAESTLPDSREAGQLEKWERYSDIAGNPVPQFIIDEAKEDTRQAKKERKEAISSFDTRLYNGPVEVGMHAPPTGFYNELGDIRWHAGGVTKRFGTQLARQMIPETMNRATLLRIEENAYVAQLELKLQLAKMLYPEIKDRQLAWYNAVLDQTTTFYRIGSSKNKIDPNSIALDYQFHATELPERLIEKAGAATSGFKEGLLDWETAVEAAAKAQGKDPEKVKRALALEGKAPQHIIDRYNRQAQRQLPGLPQRPQLRAVN